MVKTRTSDDVTYEKLTPSQKRTLCILGGALFNDTPDGWMSKKMAINRGVRIESAQVLEWQGLAEIRHEYSGHIGWKGYHEYRITAAGYAVLNSQNS